MRNFELYTNENGDCICEMLNEGLEELQNVEGELIRMGYVITNVKGLFIKCLKVKDTNND